jgi:hypothetical protein
MITILDNTCTSPLENNQKNIGPVIAMMGDIAVSISWIYSFAIWILLRPAVSAAATYYVATNGNDSYSCAQAQSINTPKRNLTGSSGALACLSAGSTLFIRSGSYPAFHYTYGSGTSWTNAITIAAQPGEIVTIGGINVAGLPAKQFIIFDKLIIDAQRAGLEAVRIADGSNHIRFTNGEIKNAIRQGVLIPHQGDTDNEFINMRIHDNGSVEDHDHGMYISGSRTLVENCDIYNNPLGWAIHIYNGYAGETTNDNIIRNNRLHNNGHNTPNGGGIITGSGSNSFIFNNLIYENKDGIVVCCSPNTQRIYNNTIYKNSRYGVEVQAGSGHNVANNIIYLSGLSNIRFLVGVNAFNNLTLDPLFVDATTFNLHLRASSPAIDSGATLPEVPTDLDGHSRPQGSAYDIGAYEFVSSTATPEPTPTPAPEPSTNDTIAPTVAITSPADGAVVARKSTLTIQATASDNVFVREVRFFVDGLLRCADQSAPFTCDWRVPASPGRSYSIEAQATDKAGNLSARNRVTVKSN